MSFAGSTTCDCGGKLAIETGDFGRTLEVCLGACGYRGPARPRLPVPVKLGPPSVDPDRPTCITCHQRPARTKRSTQCMECHLQHRNRLARERMRMSRSAPARAPLRRTA